MIKSMTGYGKAQSRLENKSIQVEVRTLNSKGIDVNFKMPQIYKEKEIEFRNMISKILERGKVEVIVNVESSDECTSYSLNRSLFKKYFRELKDLSEELEQPESQDVFASILRLPDILKSETEEVEDEEWNALKRTLQEAIEKTDRYRQSEGNHIEEDLKSRIDKISGLLKQVDPNEKQRIDNIKEKMRNSLAELDFEYDKNRFEQELIYYLEKLDITEEKVRLVKHIEYFIDTLKHSKESGGKKLNFIVQEIGREINTIGSKASDVNIQQIVVQMKDELEKIKEQLFNVL